jgi:hypothetical protein
VSKPPPAAPEALTPRKLVRALQYKPLYDYHMSLGEASRAVGLTISSRKYPLRDEAHSGRLVVFHPLPELMRVRFSALAEWYEAGSTEFPVRPRNWHTAHDYLLLPRTKEGWQERQKAFAHLCVTHAVATRLIERACCIKCGKPRAHAHHPDYHKPLLIVWLCPAHHSALHRCTYAAEQRAIKEAGRPAPTIVFCGTWRPPISAVPQRSGEEV